MLLDDIIFACLGCRKALAAPQNYVGKKVRCEHCDLAMLVPQRGAEPSIINESSADTARGLPPVDPKEAEQEELQKLPRLETKKDMNVKELRNSVKESKKEQAAKKSMTDTLTEEELLQTREVEALSRFSVYAEPAGRSEENKVAPEESSSTVRKQFPQIDELPDISESPTEEELFGNLAPEEQTYLKPTKIQASKTIRGGRRPPRAVEKKRISRKVLLILFLLFGIATAWYFMNKDTGEFIRDAEMTLAE